MLGDPGRIEAEPFGVDDLRGRQPIPLGGVRLIEQAREETQAFRQRRYRHLPAIMHHRDRVRDLLDCRVHRLFLSRHPEVVLAEDVQFAVRPLTDFPPLAINETTQ